MKHLCVKHNGQAGGLFYSAWALATSAATQAPAWPLAPMPLANNTSFIANMATDASAVVRQ